MERYFKIGELSRLYGVGTDTIRYYEELGLIRPVRGENGYRMYDIKDIWRMNVIRDLRGLGFSMERIRDYLCDRSVQSTLDMLAEEQAAIRLQMEELERLHANVQRRKAAIEAAQKKPVGVVEQARFAARRCHEIRQPFTGDEEMDILLKQLLNQLQNRLYIIGNTHIGCRMDPAAVLKGQYHQYESVFIIDEEGPGAHSVIPAGDYLTLRYQGSSSRGDEYVPMLFSYAKAHGHSLTGEVIELILIDIHEASDYGEHLTELQALIAVKGES